MKKLALFAIIALAVSSCAPGVGSVTGKGCYSENTKKEEIKKMPTYESMTVTVDRSGYGR